MGVQGLWELLAPVGRRVSVETLANRKLAIDASIWMVQFMKAMRDDKGEMIRNAHLIGFFRRICKLLFLRVKPVFVFDGGTPALKRRTVIARRRQRENAQTKIRKTAEKLLLNHLRTRRLEDLAQEIQNAKGNGNSPRDKNPAIRETRAELEADTPHSSQAANASPNYEAADAILAASLAAEEEEQFERALSHEEIYSDKSDDMGDSDQMVLQVMPGKIDPAVLAALPPSMQLDLLVQMREQLMAENRQKFQKVKKAPSSFSQLQIQSYLKTVAFRREIDEVQKAAGGRGVGGMPTSRIASESGREFIFSSSFTGDKQALNFPPSNTDNTEEGRPVAQENVPAASSVPSSMINSSIASFNSVVMHQNESSNVDSDPPVQTYIDEKGQVRVSRVRGMGARMTRDLQWNLYLMKESEERALKKATNNMKAGSGDRDLGGEDLAALPVGVDQTNEHEVEALDVTELRHERESLSNADTGENEMSLRVDDHSKSDSQCKNMRGLQISFLADELGEEDDDMFAALVSGESIPEHTSDDVCREADTHDHTEDNASECEWEEGQIMATGESETIQGAPLSTSLPNVSEKFPIDGSGISGDSEVEWEDGDIVLDNETGVPSTEGEKIGSRVLLSEEAELQEAIRRSLEDLGASRPKGNSSQLVIKGTQQGNFKEDPAVGMPIQVSSHRNYIDIDDDIYIDKVSDKKHGKGFAEQERARKGKAVFSEGLDNSSEKNNSKLQGPQGLVDQSESNPKLTITKEILSENLTPSGGSIPAHKKNVEDEHLSALNAMEGSSMVEEFPVAVGSTMLHEMQNNEHHSHTANIGELQNNNKDSALQFPEPRQSVRMTVADHRTSIQNFKIDATDDIVSGSGRTSPPSVTQAGEMNQHPEEVPEDNLIREVEESDLSKDRETLTRKEAELLAKKQDYLRKKEEFQAELEAEKEALQAGVDEEMVFLRQEELDLRTAQKKNERNAESVSSEMFAECQELLQMFGLPYIIAPMEAEAQCAFMELVHLVDGVVTDDCDVFLFGARSVYKNIFDDRKYVETYFMKDIEEELGLNRQKLIRMALLLGSDYTEGISGIGIVNAIEVVNAFPEEDGLKDFKGWLDSPDPSLLEKVHTHSGKTSRKRSSKPNKKSEYEAEEKEGEDIVLDQTTQRGQVDGPSEERNFAVKQIFMEKHRTVSKNWHVPDSFPNEAVISAYTAPQVDKSTEPFSWGRPDLMALRKLCWERFGWTKEKADELLLPVLKEYDRHETQLRLEAFYSFSERFAKIRSRRIQKAVTGITGHRSSAIMDLPPHLMSTPLKRSRKNKENGISSGASEDAGNQARADNKRGKLTGEVPGKKDGKQERKNEMDSILVEPGNRAGKVSTGGKGRGRGRAGKVRGRGRAGRGRARRAQPISSADESESEEENETSEEGQLKRKFSAEPVELRKSTRCRREVKYASNERESDSVGYILNDSDRGTLCEESERQVLQKQPQVLSDSFRSEHDGADFQTRWQPTTSKHAGNTGFRDGGPCTDYLATGGGFCFEEGNNVNDLDANKDNVVGNVISDEDNIKCSTSESIPMHLSSQVLSTGNNVEHLHCGVGYRVSEGADRLASGEDLSNNRGKELEFEEGAVGNTNKERNLQLSDATTEIKPETNNAGSVLGLRSMPFLRRKRRTSA